ncbi:MAG: FAD-dependent oxidoreductase [Pirellulales bacterium]
MLVRMPITVVLLATIVSAARPASADDVLRADVCVYAATPSGIVAAVTAKQEGRSVVLIEPSRWVGGILARELSRCKIAPSPGPSAA